MAASKSSETHPTSLTTSKFEQFVQKIAAVPKEAVEQLEAERIKRPKPKRRGKALN